VREGSGQKKGEEGGEVRDRYEMKEGKCNENAERTMICKKVNGRETKEKKGINICKKFEERI